MRASIQTKLPPIKVEAITGTVTFHSMSAAKETWSAESYNKNASFVYSPTFTSAVLSLLDAKPGERIVDFGCGTGELTFQIQSIVTQVPGGVVVGVDSSESMVNKTLANGVQHAVAGDIQDLKSPNDWDPSLQSGFDAVFSNGVLHWCKRNPTGVLESAKKLLKPGGRLVVEMCGHMNCIGVRSALHAVLRHHGHDALSLDPMYLPTVEEYRKLLDSSGFAVSEIGLYPRLVSLSSSFHDFLHFLYRDNLLRGIGDVEAEEILRETEKMCEVDSKDAAGNWSAMGCMLRFAATVKG